jgi:energy-coupling factor transporter ATP-binding protein EcfA2
MDGQIQMALYRIEAIVNRVSDCVDRLEKLEDMSGNLSYGQSQELSAIIKDLKEIQ